MPTKKRYFTRNKKKVYHSPQDRTSLGNKSGKARESIRLVRQPAVLAQDKKTIKPIFPNYSLTIAEYISKLKIYLSLGFSWQKGAILAFSLAIFGLSLWQAVVLTQHLLELQQVLAKRSQLSDQLSLWENISQKYPSYRDAYFQSAVLAYQLGDRQKENDYLMKTLQIDPNYQPAQKLEQK